MSIALRRAPTDGIGVARELRVEGLRGGHQFLAVVVEAGGGVGSQVAKLVAVAVPVEDREHRLRGTKRERLAAEIDARGEELVLETVGALGDVGDDDPAQTGLTEAVEALALVAGGRVLLVAERLVLLAGEEVGVAGDDLRLLARLLLPHAHRACLLGALVEIAVQPFLELQRGQSCQFPSRFLDSEAFEHILVTAPVRPHLDLQVEVDLAAEKPLDLGPRAGADGLDHAAALADEDALLGLGLDDEDSVHPRLLELFDLDADRVRHLLARERERLLADELRDPRLDREVGRLALTEVERPLGEQRDEIVLKRAEPFAAGGADRVERVEIAEARRDLDLLGDSFRA